MKKYILLYAADICERLLGILPLALPIAGVFTILIVASVSGIWPLVSILCFGALAILYVTLPDPELLRRIVRELPFKQKDE